MTDTAAAPGSVAPAQPGAGAPSAAAAPFTELTARRLGPIRRYFAQHPVAMDLLVMAVFALGSVSGVWLETSQDTLSRPDAALVLVGTVVATAVLLWRRRAPVTVTAVVVALGVATVVVTGTPASFDLAMAAGIYAVAASRPAWTAWSVLLASAGALSLTIVFWGDRTSLDVDDTGQQVLVDPRTSMIVAITIVSLASLAIGTSVRNRRLHVADLVERANALARDREQQAQLARAAERSRIAREMHDVVAHSLSVMIALADGAGVALERAPDKARTALGELSETGRAALADMRRVLGVLDGAQAPLEPQPGSPDLADLVERFRMAGLVVRARGLEAALPDDAGLQLAVYRIVQESLTNALRHAPGTAAVDLALTPGPDALAIEVVDHGPAVARPPSPGAGRGLIGMRERAGVYGGTVETGPWQGGWRVAATLPWRRDTR